MTWPRVPLDNVKSTAPYSLVGGPFGSEITTRDYVAEGVPVIRGNNLGGHGKFLDDDFAYVNDEKAALLRSNTAYPGDLIFTQRGTLGQVGLIPKDARFNRYIVSQSQMKLTVDEQKADPLFLYYFFRLPSTVQQILNRVSSSGVPHINLSVLKAFEIPLPPKSTQTAIVQIAWPYDELIENNRRRIRLLEESTRLLYQEWFVRFRFPGHEHTRISSGLPEGWGKRALESVCIAGDGIQTGPFGSQLHQSDYCDVGVPVVMPKDLISFRIRTEGIAQISESLAEKLSRHRMIEGDTVYGRRGDIGRRAFVSERQVGWLCGTGCLRIRPDAKEINSRFLFDTLGAPDTAGTIANRAKGATMSNLNSTVLKSVPVLVPPRPLQELYAAHLQPIGDLVELLSEQNSKLKAARDLLLPRLMSGEVEV
jgi:type I restriction enzyme S subunit